MDFRTNDRNYYYGILSVSQQSQSTDANTSTLAYSLTLYAGNTWFSGYTIGYRVKVDGAQVAYHDNYGNQTSMSRNSSKLVCSGTTTVQHDDDGQKTVAVEAEIWTDSSSGLPVYLSCSGSMTLDQILRESSIAATDANIGATTMIVVARRKESYTHSIAFDFGSLSGYLLADGTICSLEAKLTATQIGWTLPASFYAQIPTAKFGTVRLTCRTYNGDKQVGTARTATFRATAAEDDCAPTVSGTVEDTNAATIALTGDASKLVRFCSTALCTITAAAKNGAALASKSIAGETVEGSSRAISAVELDSFVFAAAGGDRALCQADRIRRGRARGHRQRQGTSDRLRQRLWRLLWRNRQRTDGQVPPRSRGRLDGHPRQYCGQRLHRRGDALQRHL